MKKALMYASVASMIQQFNMDNIKLLQELGYKVDVACNFEFGSTISEDKIDKLKQKLHHLGIDYYHIPIPRKITDYKNLSQSYKKTIALMNNMHYDLIHCHSPIGGMICRIANEHCDFYNNSKMIYTAHGFHFFKGNNLIKNFVFKNMEKYAAKRTDILITINKEDFEAAKKFKLKTRGQVKYIPGVGIDINGIKSIANDECFIKKELGLPINSKVLLSVGELNKNKNHIAVIESMKKFPEQYHYVICGDGPLNNYYKTLIHDLNLEDRVHLLGFRSDIYKIMKSSDFFIFPSKREGLSVALMEAMACNCFCIVSRIRGNIDLIEHEIGGITIEVKNFEKELPLSIFNDNYDFKKMAQYSFIKISEYSIEEINKRIKEVYCL